MKSATFFLLLLAPMAAHATAPWRAAEPLLGPSPVPRLVLPAELPSGGEQKAGGLDAQLQTPGPQLLPPPTRMGPGESVAILGQLVTFRDGSELGRIVDVLVDEKGAPRAAVLDTGGFFGVGDRKVALGWNLLHFAPNGQTDHVVQADARPTQILSAPEYREAHAVMVISEPAPPPPSVRMMPDSNPPTPSPAETAPADPAMPGPHPAVAPTAPAQLPPSAKP